MPLDKSPNPVSAIYEPDDRDDVGLFVSTSRHDNPAHRCVVITDREREGEGEYLILLTPEQATRLGDALYAHARWVRKAIPE